MGEPVVLKYNEMILIVMEAAPDNQIGDLQVLEKSVRDIAKKVPIFSNAIL